MITYEWLYVLSGIFFAIWAVLSALAVPWRAMACFDPSHTDKHPPEMLHGLHVDEIVARVATASLGRDDDPSLAVLCDPSLAAANGTADAARPDPTGSR